MSRDEFYTADVRVVWPSAPASGESRTTGVRLPAVMSPAGLRSSAYREVRRRAIDDCNGPDPSKAS